MNASLKPAIAPARETLRVPTPDRRICLDAVLVLAAAEKIPGKHPRPSGVLPVLILIAESDFHDEAATSNLLPARSTVRTGLNVIVPGWVREFGTGDKDAEQNGMFTFGEVTVNVPTMEVSRNGRIVKLRCKEFQLLLHLLKNPRRVISRNELLKDVWGYQSYPTTRTVDNHILRLRQKLEREPNQPRHFVTIHGVGCRFLP